MCRWVVYRGEDPLLLADLLIRSKHSLIKQSYKSRERREPLNGDGFGVGWYDWQFGETPCVYKSIRPAWADLNLHRLSHFVRSPCLFAHVRAATKGFPVTELNCHPFMYKQLLWMHNGHIPNFQKIKRKLQESLSDEAYQSISGTTDSEHCFALFLDHLDLSKESYSVEDIKNAVHGALEKLAKWSSETDLGEACAYNFAVTDGRHVVATRHATGPDAKAESLYYALGKRYEPNQRGDKIIPAHGQPRALLIASEPITDSAWEWVEVPTGHSLTLDADYNLQFHTISS